jgi:hypothetical protein
VFALSQFLIQSPKHLDDAERSRRDRVRKVTTRRRHSTDDTHGALAFRAADTFNASSALIERGQASTEVSWVTAEMEIRNQF